MKKLLPAVFSFFLLLFSIQSKAQLTIGNVDAGPYTPGSSIAATFIIGSTCIPVGNVFTLYLSDATGNFAAETAIGTFNGFYSTYVNGVIPTTTLPGTGYRVRIGSSTPVSYTLPSVPITITAGTPVIAKVNAPASTISTNPTIFGSCNTDPNTPSTTFFFDNASTSTNVTVTINNELNPGTPATLTYSAGNQTQTYTAGLAHYTLFVKALMPDGTVGTQAYFLINNLAVTAFTTTGANTVCFPTGAFQYSVDVSNNGIKANFPGNTYKIDWGDGSTSQYTYCDIISNNNLVTHTFTKSSCGLSYTSGTQTTYNAFGVNVGVYSPYCGAIGSPLSTAAKVVTKPTNKFNYPPIACKGDVVTFVNLSTPGQNPNSGGSSCTNNTVFYTWYVDGIVVLSNVPVSTNMTHTFTTTGLHTIRLTSVSNGSCQADDISNTICIQNPPQPSFTLPATTICLTPGTLTPVNTSILDNTSCPSTPVYTWAVKKAGGAPAAGVTYTPSASNVAPTFKFTQAGIYTITLSIQTGTCSVISAPQTVYVNSEPVATLSPDASLCALGSFTFGPTGTITKTTVSGTVLQLSDTYTWTVTGATGYNFASPDGPNTQYPTLNFTGYGTYTVTLVHKNNCNTVTKTQVIKFSPSPIPNIIANPPQVCYSAPVNLQGTITNGTYVSFVWSSTGAGVFSNPNSLITNYTPTSAEQAAGSTTIRLLVNTGIPGACAQVVDNVTVNILPNNTGTSSSTQNICTGGTATTTLRSTVAGSTFTWTAANADGNATGYSPAGNTTVISDIINNSSATNNAVVIYTITPQSNGCPGVPFTFKVTVTPKPVITAVPAQPVICSNHPAAITITSNLTGTKYTWTSTSTPDIMGNSTKTTATAATAINDILSNNSTTQGTVTYIITPISPTGCPGAAVTVTVKIDPPVTIANAGPDDSICDQNGYVLKGNAPTVGTGLWTVVSAQTGVVFANNTEHNTAVTGLISGQTYTFKWTISAPGACDATMDNVVIIVNTPTIAGTTGGTATVCAASNSGNITLTGNVGNVLRWESSIDGGINWIPIANTTNTLTYTNITATTQYRAVVQNGSCESKISTLTKITVTRATTIAAAGAGQLLCNQGSTILDGNMPNSGDTGQWTVITGTPNVVFSNPANPKTTVTGLVPGQAYVFRWTITGLSPCGPTMDEVSITDDLPLTNTLNSTSTVVCYGQAITINGSTPTGGNGTYSYIWESSTDGTTWSLINGQTGKNLTFTLLATTSFRRTVTSSTCTLISNVIRVIAQPPIANNTIAADQTICTGLVPAPLTGSTPTGADGNYNYQWQLSTDNGGNWTDISSAVFIAYAPPALTGTTLYRRIVSTITCNGNLRSISAPVTITVKPNAKAEYTFTTDKACTPFVINTSNIKAIPYPDRNATYTWYADNVQIGTGITFPGYTISTANVTVTIKLVATSSLGCTQDEFSHVFSTNQSIAASFTQSINSGCSPLVVNFVNTSTSLANVTFKWDFGNGTTSSQTMPAAVTFLSSPLGKDTTYTVTLTAITACGSNSVKGTVLVKASPISIFSPSRTVGCAPLTVTFSNTSPGGSNTYYYDFGDGTLLTKTDRSPVQHTFTTAVVKDFVVKMVAQNECGSNESSYTIRVSPNTVLPELVVNADNKQGCAPLTVKFYNNSKGADSFKYTFGDGSTVLTRSAPEVVTHTFTAAGTYTVTLLASNGCSDTTTTESITVLPQPLAAFSADHTLGCPGLVVQFKNTSTDGISYLWDFGDGATSTEFEPKHIFTGDKEFYTVSLTATNTLSCTYTATMNEYIHIVPPPIALFNVSPSTVISIPDYTFRFEDESTGSPSVWLWNFGDGVTSALKNPTHTYLDTGTYVVTLRAANQQGCFTTTFKNVTIVGVPGYLYVPNAFMPGSKTPELRTFIAKGSGIKTWRMSIFNKWGQDLWQTTLLNDGRPVEGWDGTFQSVPVPQGVYYWKIDVEFINGSAWKGMTYNSSAPKKTGVIHLLR